MNDVQCCEKYSKFFCGKFNSNQKYFILVSVEYVHFSLLNTSLIIDHFYIELTWEKFMHVTKHKLNISI